MGGRLELLQGDCRDVLPTLEGQSIQCCVTSPPYWGLRDYGTETWAGGDAGCMHVKPVDFITSTLGASAGGRSDETHERSIRPKPYRDICGKCGARRIDAQLGLEESPSEYISKMVRVFREVWRVLRNDGTLWLNMGDCYAHNGACGGGSPVDDRDPEKYGRIARPSDRSPGRLTDRDAQIKTGGSCKSGLKPKDLLMMPARLAMALQADGWYLRSDIIWHKPNPMPESVTDRPTKAHEYIFLLTKAERYFYDAEAIRELSIYGGDIKTTNGNDGMSYGQDGNRTRDGFRRGVTVKEMRNKRSVWTVATQPYAEAHFATFPEDLIKPCILAGSKPGDTVLDPFAGSGTTGKVAIECGRSAILIELSPAYVALARDRTNVTAGFF